MNIAIIPARGGSKRIPRKNIKLFFGKPMIAWSIEVARAAGIFDKIIVSTDDNEISEISRRYGAETPFIRPEHLSNDFAGTTQVVAHATKWALEQGWAIQSVCCIYATAPFVSQKDLRLGLEMLNSGTWDYVFSATEFAAPIFRSFRSNNDGGLEMYFPNQFHARSQDLPVALHDAGQFYWGRPGAWVKERIIFGKNSTCLILPRWRVQDIDNDNDWLSAELLAPQIMQHLQN